MFGGMFQTAEGFAWYTPQSVPLRLTQKLRVRSSIVNAVAQVNGSLVINKSYPFMIFFSGQSDSNYQVVPTLNQTNYGVDYRAVSYSGANTANFYLDVYVFSCEPKSSPSVDYGAAFYDESGNLILDSSDRVLTDLTSIGQGPTTLQGKYAITPALAGGRQYQVSGGGPGGNIFPIPTAFSCNYSNGSTIVASDVTLAPPSQGIVGGFVLNNTISIINTSRYD